MEVNSVVRVLSGVAAVAAASAGMPAAHATFTGFTSPSGNIGCMMDTDYVRCDILEHDWVPPLRPATCPSFTGYGQGIVITAGTAAAFVCAGDTVLRSGDPLDYGQSMTNGVMSCTSVESGVTCRDMSSGHGFTISRQEYQLF